LGRSSARAPHALAGEAAHTLVEKAAREERSLALNDLARKREEERRGRRK
jgi:hypothetical protein